MLLVTDYIKNYAEAHGIKKYTLKSRVLTKNDFADIQAFAPGVAFFYKLQVTGDIVSTDDLQKNLLTATSNVDFFDFAKIARVRDFSTLQTAEADFVFECADQLKLELSEGGENSVFSKIHSAQLFYLYFLPQQQEAAAADARRISFDMKY